MKSFDPRLLFVAIIIGLTLTTAAHAAPHGVFWVEGQRPQSAPNPNGSGKLVYYGGPVISNAKVYAVLWGNNVASETRSLIGDFYANILNSGYMDWLSEYNTDISAIDGRPGTNQKIGRGTFAGTVTIQPTNPSSDLTDAMIQRELETQITANNLPAPNANSLYMVYFPAEISVSIENMRSCSTFCAYHEGFKAKNGAAIFYGVMPVCSWGCGWGSAFNTLSIISSHEAIEAITDPFPTPGSNPAYPQAWNTTGGEEIGDLCAGGSSTVTGNGITSAVQHEWDNSTNSCNAGPWTKSVSSAVRPLGQDKVSSLLLLEEALRTRTSFFRDGR